MAHPSDLCIISGGQTGTDRAALDFAINHGIAHGGWCPLGRRAEDGVLAAKYQLQETTSRRYDQRTRWNVRDSDATLLLTIGPELSGGTELTALVAQREGKPWLHLSRQTTTDVASAAQQVCKFLKQHKIRRLNVAGPRASQEPDVGAFTVAVLTATFAD